VTPLRAVRCKRRRAKNDSGPRKAALIRHVVVHSTEGGTAASFAAFFATTARASTQLVVDERECYRCVPDLVIPWGAPGVNTTGLHVEHCGFARWTREEWLAHEATLHRSAAKAALWCWIFGIPRRWLTVTELRAGKAGFCRHVDASRAYRALEPHTDPGSGFPRDVYLTYVRDSYREISSARQGASGL
jgi:N-acetylmuramoyl-L-alanine amidase